MFLRRFIRGDLAVIVIMIVVLIVRSHAFQSRMMHLWIHFRIFRITRWWRSLLRRNDRLMLAMPLCREL